MKKEDRMLIQMNSCVLLILAVPMSEAFVRQSRMLFHQHVVEKPVVAAQQASAWDSLEQKLFGDGNAATTVSSRISDMTSNKPAATIFTEQPAQESITNSASDMLSNLLKEQTTPSLLDATMTNAQSVLSSAREIASLRAESGTVGTIVASTTAPNSFVQPQQQSLLTNAQDAMAGVPDSMHNLEVTIQNLLKGAPPGEGLSKPIVDYVMTTLYDMRDSPYNPPNWIHAELPQNYVKIPGGFEMKSSIVNAVADATTTAIATSVETKSRLAGFVPYFVDNLKLSYEHSAPLRATMANAMQATPVLMQREYQVLADRTAQAGDTLVSAGGKVLDWDAWKQSVDQLAIVQADMQQLLRTPGWRPEDVLVTLKMKELGPFYMGIAAAMLLALSYNNQRLASLEKNPPVVATPRRATPKAQTAVSSKSGTGEQVQLESIVADLTQATAILAAEMKGMATELKELKSKQQMEVPVAPATMMQSVAKSSSQAVAEAESELAKKLNELELQNELLRNQLNTAKFEADTLAEVNEALNAGVEALATMSKEPVVPQTPLSLEELGLSDAYFVAGLNGAAAEKEAKQSKTTAVMAAPDWSNLSLGALKKKTESELREYLESKGLQSKDKTGRPLAKPDLLVLVMTAA